MGQLSVCFDRRKILRPCQGKGRPLTNGPVHGGAEGNYVTRRIFDVFRSPVTRGRSFAELDDAGSTPVVVINEAMATRYWKNENPIGQRTLESGIRLALGADTRGLRNMVLRQAMTLAVIGTGSGLLAALGLTRFLATLLCGVKPTDPLIFASVACLLSGVAFPASFLAARRVLRVDPVTSLRCE